MTSGGRRNRSGPKADEASARSEIRGFKLTALPAEGYDGPVPAFPLPRRFPVDCDVPGLSDAVHAREIELWESLWTTPQACAWSMRSERWRWNTIAMYVRTFVICEGNEATAADKSGLHRFADQIGLTTAGLHEMGWKIAVDEVGEKRAEHEQQEPAPAEPPKRRLRAADAKR